MLIRSFRRIIVNRNVLALSFIRIIHQRCSHLNSYIYIYHATWTYHRSNAIRFALALRGSQARSLPASLAVQLNHGTPFSPKGLHPNLHKRLPLLSPSARGALICYNTGLPTILHAES